MTTTDTKTGIFPGMSHEEYAAIPAMNCSLLTWGLASMRHLKAAIDGELVREDTPALNFGRAMHIRILEPDQYSARVKVKGTCAAELASGKRKGEKCGAPGRGLDTGLWVCGQHGGDPSSLDTGCEYVSAEEAESIEAVAAALKARKADTLRRAKGEFEVAVVAELFGVMCKARLDKRIIKPSAIVDLKKVYAATNGGDSQVSERAFSYRIASHGYGLRAAFYCDLLSKITGEMPRWYWLVVEDGPPYTSAVYRASDRCLQAGRNEYAALLEGYKRGLETGEWPGPGDEPVELDGPAKWLSENGV